MPENSIIPSRTVEPISPPSETTPVFSVHSGFWWRRRVLPPSPMLLSYNVIIFNYEPNTRDHISQGFLITMVKHGD